MSETQFTHLVQHRLSVLVQHRLSVSSLIKSCGALGRPGTALIVSAGHWPLATGGNYMLILESNQKLKDTFWQLTLLYGAIISTILIDA